jgi:type I restriction enzyme S subunit
MNKFSKLGEVLNGKTIPKKPGIIPAYGGNGIISYVDDWNYPENTIIIGRVGAYCGAIHQSKSKCWVTDNALAFIVNDNNNPNFVFYLLKSINLNRFNIGSSQPLITQSIIYDIEYDYITDPEKQAKIAKILNTIDSIIENNTKINVELENMAKNLYDYWFLQFEFPNEEGKPYKSSGGNMIWNEDLKREIPKGWESKKLSDILEKVNRKYDFSTNSKTYDLSIMASNSISLYDTSNSVKFDTNLFSVKKGDLLFGSIRPYLRKAGIAAYDGAVTGTVYCYEVKNSIDYNTALFTITSENLFKYAINNSKGTKMPIVSSEDLLNFNIPYNEEISKLFNNLPIKEKIVSSVIQSNELASLRDFLLPLLMNGQVSFK